MTRDSRPFWRRFLIYQQERFPFLVHGLLVGSFTFSAVAYSRISRGAEGFISLADFLGGFIVTLSLFFLVRIFDEFKDREDDAQYRSYLPVPRGLVTLGELRVAGWVAAAVQIAVILIFQWPMWALYAVVLAYLLLMGVEFFVPRWLKAHWLLYITSHMFIIPLIDLYASGLDWRLAGVGPHWGLAWFFAVSYFNGLVLELGRKMRTPAMEEEGVLSYTNLYGYRGGPLFWLVLLAATAALAMGAAHYAGYGWLAYAVFGGAFVLSALPGILFIIQPTKGRAKGMEYASAGWTLLMYLALGGIPMLTNLLS